MPTTCSGSLAFVDSPNRPLTVLRDPSTFGRRGRQSTWPGSGSQPRSTSVQRLLARTAAEVLHADAYRRRIAVGALVVIASVADVPRVAGRIASTGTGPRGATTVRAHWTGAAILAKAVSERSNWPSDLEPQTSSQSRADDFATANERFAARRRSSEILSRPLERGGTHHRGWHVKNPLCAASRRHAT